MRNKSLRKFWVKEQKFSIRFYKEKAQKLLKSFQKQAKTPLFSGVFAVFVPRETDDKNQIVPRETYMFLPFSTPCRRCFL